MNVKYTCSKSKFIKMNFKNGTIWYIKQISKTVPVDTTYIT